MESTKPILSTTGLMKNFNGVQALAGLSLEVKPGIFGLIGPNGAGKTTLLRILLGLIRPDAGNARVLEMDIQDQSLDIRRRVGVLHERPSFPKAMTAREYLTRVGRLYKRSRDPQELLSIVGLSDASDRMIGNLSAGMQQRMGIAQALIGSPELVFLDEPSSNLDVSGRDEMVQLIVDLNHEEGISFFIASHILSELERACHYVAFVKEGVIVEQGDLLELVERYTKNILRVVTSDARKLRDEVVNIEGVVSSMVTGANNVTITTKVDTTNEVQLTLEEIAEKSQIKVYSVEKGSSLEDAYKEIMR